MQSIKRKESVLIAIQEYNELGRTAFFSKYELSNSSQNNFDFFILFEDKEYECKPIFQAAYHYEFDEKITKTSGVTKKIKPNLESLGFNVIERSMIKATNFYWVNIGTSYKEVAQYKFLWAPENTVNQKGQVIVEAGWKAVPFVKKSDVLFCNYKGSLIHVAVAKDDAYSAPRPENRSFDQWKNEGYKIDVELHTLKIPIDNTDFIDDFIPQFNEHCNPKLFAKNKTVSQKYMVKLPASAGAFLLGFVGDEALQIQDSLLINKVDDNKNKIPEGSERETISKARVGQGKFRQEVLKVWNEKCALTGVGVREILVASHIIPWQLSNNKQKVDKYNGLALSPDVDKLFDKGFISFDDNGSMLVKSSLPDETLNQLGIKTSKRIEGLKEQHLVYLRKHRELYDF